MPVDLPIYMDNHATTRVDPRVLDEMLPFERLAQTDSRSLQTLVREAEAQMLMLALAGDAKDTRNAFLGCLSSRARVHCSHAAAASKSGNGWRSSEWLGVITAGSLW